MSFKDDYLEFGTCCSKIQNSPTIKVYTHGQLGNNSGVNFNGGTLLTDLLQLTNNTTANGGGNAVNSQSGLRNTISSESHQKGKD